MGIGTLEGVKSWRSIVLAGIVIAGVVYVYLHRAELGLAGLPGSVSAGGAGTAQSEPAPGRPARISWETAGSSKDGFTVEMPTSTREIQLPSYGENGAAGVINMIYSNPDPATTFSVSWADDPPVMEANNRAPDRTLDMARDEALARTQTTLVSESRSNPGGFPARDFLARNVAGGVMDTRLICMGNRLYMLTAAFPSMGARREQDVTRFFNSFRVAKQAGIPETLPPASEPVKPN